MKRHHLIVASGLVVLIGFAWWAKTVASWRPVVIGKIPLRGQDEINLWACDRGVLAEYGPDSYSFFDALSGTSTLLASHENTKHGLTGSFLWQADFDKGRGRDVLTLTGLQGEKYTYFLPHQTLNLVRALPEQNCVEVLGDLPFYKSAFYKFDLTQGRVIHQWTREATTTCTLSRDGASVVDFDNGVFRISDANTGKVRQRIVLQGDSLDTGPTFSSYGQYAVYGHIVSLSGVAPLSTAMTASYNFHVVRVATGQVLWSQQTDECWAISDDERTIFTHKNDRWQMRELSTGKVLRQFPYFPGTTAAALSSDGATLYSVANGVLYKQRVK